VQRHYRAPRITESEKNGAKAKHLESVPITEKFQGRTVWDRVVEVFRLKGHPQTDKVYAWINATDDPAHSKRHVTVLYNPPAVSPRTAVQAFIVQDFTEQHGKAN
jgi:hypothetical protein